MKKYIAIIRGINVSGKNILKMAELRSSLSMAGFQDVVTYIQSGNIVFTHQEENENNLANDIRQLISKDFDIQAPVIVIDSKEFLKIVEANPFLKDKDKDIARLAITFLSEVPENEQMAGMIQLNDLPNEAIAGEKAIYLYTPYGYSKTKWTNNYIESRLKLTATTRNLKTCRKLIELAEES